MKDLNLPPHEIETEYKDKIINVLTSLFPEAKIYLFGSRARGTHSKSSDIDLAIDAGQRVKSTQIHEANEVMSALSIPYYVDVVDIHHISPDMKDQILKDKIIMNRMI